MNSSTTETEVFPQFFPSRPPEDRPAGNGETILVVDDEQLVLDNLTRILDRFNYRVLTARSGIAAIETFRRHQRAISLVILDIIMPDMNGAALLHVLRILAPELKAVAISGYSPLSPEIELLHRDQEHFLAKPFSTSELLCMVRNTLDEGPAQTPGAPGGGVSARRRKSVVASA
jgi:DNA-binding NtrC family response regulator